MMFSDDSDSQAASLPNTVDIVETPLFKAQNGNQYPNIPLETLGNQFDLTHGFGNVNTKAEMLLSFKEDFE